MSEIYKEGQEVFVIYLNYGSSAITTGKVIRYIEQHYSGHDSGDGYDALCTGDVFKDEKHRFKSTIVFSEREDAERFVDMENLESYLNQVETLSKKIVEYNNKIKEIIGRRI